MGYLFHLVTDNLWDREVFQPVQLRYRRELEQDANFLQDQGRLVRPGLLYVRDHPDSLFWREFLQCSYSADWLEFMPPEAVQRRIAYIQNYYRDEDRQQEAAQRHYLYLVQAEMDRFVDGAASGLYPAIDGRATSSYTVDAVHVALADHLHDCLVTLDRQQLERCASIVEAREPWDGHP